MSTVIMERFNLFGTHLNLTLDHRVNTYGLGISVTIDNIDGYTMSEDLFYLPKELNHDEFALTLMDKENYLTKFKDSLDFKMDTIGDGFKIKQITSDILNLKLEIFPKVVDDNGCEILRIKSFSDIQEKELTIIVNKTNNLIVIQDHTETSDGVTERTATVIYDSNKLIKKYIDTFDTELNDSNEEIELDNVEEVYSDEDSKQDGDYNEKI